MNNAELLAEPVQIRPHPEEQETVMIHGAVNVDGAREPVDWTAEIPAEHIIYNGLTVLVPGFGGVKVSSRAERHANAVMGRPTISYEPARVSYNVIENLFNSQDLHTRTAEAVIFDVQDRVANDRNIPNPEELDAERIVASGHSMGGFPVTELGLRHPGMIESVIYKGAAGFWPLSLLDMNPVKLMKSVNNYVASGQIEPSVRNLYRIMRYYARNPSRTAGEALTCLTSDISEKVAQLEDEGVSTGYLAFEYDELVSADKAYEKAKGVVGHFALLQGLGHLAPQSHSKETAEATWDLQEIIQSEQKPALFIVNNSRL